jgi:hypothetical protein
MDVEQLWTVEAPSGALGETFNMRSRGGAMNTVGIISILCSLDGEKELR